MDSKHRGCVFFLSRSRYERLIRSVFESLMPKEFQDQSTARSPGVFCLMKGKRNNCVCVSVALNLRLLSLDIFFFFFFFNRKWQWVSLNHGCLLVRGTLWGCRFAKQALKIAGGNFLSGALIQSDVMHRQHVNRCSCNERMGTRV